MFSVHPHSTRNEPQWVSSWTDAAFIPLHWPIRRKERERERMRQIHQGDKKKEPLFALAFASVRSTFPAISNGDSHEVFAHSVSLSMFAFSAHFSLFLALSSILFTVLSFLAKIKCNFSNKTTRNHTSPIGNVSWKKEIVFTFSFDSKAPV